jgi:hypothetical protein
VSARRARALIERYRIAGCEIVFRRQPGQGWQVEVALRTGTSVLTRWHRRKADAMGEALRRLDQRDRHGRGKRIPRQLAAMIGVTALASRAENGR